MAVAMPRLWRAPWKLQPDGYFTAGGVTLAKDRASFCGRPVPGPLHVIPDRVAIRCTGERKGKPRNI